MKKKRSKKVTSAPSSVCEPTTALMTYDPSKPQSTRWAQASDPEPYRHPRAEMIEMTKVALASLIAKGPAYMQNPDDAASIAYSDRYRKSCAKAAVSYAIHALNAISEQGNVK